MFKSILAATALVIAASAVPAAAYDGESRHHSKSYNSYSHSDRGHRDMRVYRSDRHHADREDRHSRRWWHRRYRDYDDAYVNEHHYRRHWWQRRYWN